MSSCKKYLQEYAEVEVKSLDTFLSDETYSNCVVIPAYNETKDFLQRFINSSLLNNSVLLILVINQPDSEIDSAMQKNLYNQCKLSGTQLWKNRNLTLVSWHACRI